jgi:manganese-dependent inorganic pyrophosphatase
MKRVLITSYVNPDLDGVASAVAYAEFLKNPNHDVLAGVIGKPHTEADYMLKRFGVAEPVRLQNADGFDEVILVDVSDVNELEGTIAPEKVIEIMDHRAVHGAGAFPNAKAQIEPVGAAATLVAEKFMYANAKISEESAALLLGGIISNTLNFRGSMTTDRDRSAAAWLNATAQLPDGFWRELFTAKSDVTGDQLAERIEDDVAWFMLGGKKFGIAELEVIGIQPLLAQRGGEIIEVMERVKHDAHFDHIFLNAIELEDIASYLVASDTQTQQLLSHVFATPFDGVVAKLPHPLMRKQIVPQLKRALE